MNAQLIMTSFYIRLVAFCLLYFSCTSARNSTQTINTPAQKTDTVPAAALHPFGRAVPYQAGHLELISSAAHFGFSFEGTECRIWASLPSGGHNYLQYELDGRYEKRLRISGNAAQPVVIKAQQKGRHTVWVYKATEAHTGAIAIQNVIGMNVTALQKRAAPLIEFIGNSITCGAAADASEVPCGAGAYHDQHNAYYAYGPRVARALGANFIISGVSGIGVYRNWNSDGPAMPQVYEKADFREASALRWNFDLYSPQVVSIALGTNDFSKGDGIKQRDPFDSTQFVSKYVRFVQLVKSKYPAARIALLSSAIINGEARLLLQNCLTAVKEQVDTLYPTVLPVALYFFEPMQPRGCTGHPSVDDHAVLAKSLEPFFRKLLAGQ